MEFDLSTLRAMDAYKLLSSLIVPRPIAWTVTQSVDGVLNAAPFSFFNILSGNPPVVALGLGSNSGREHDTTKNIRETGEFVVNLVGEEQAQAMNITAAEFEPIVNELQMAGVKWLPATKVKPPRIADSPASFECERIMTLEVGPKSFIVLGRVVTIHVREDIIEDADKFYIATEKLRLAFRMGGGGWYGRTTDTFNMPGVSPETLLARTKSLQEPGHSATRDAAGLPEQIT